MEEGSQSLENVVCTVHTSGTYDSKVNYELEADNSHDGSTSLDELFHEELCTLTHIFLDYAEPGSVAHPAPYV